MNKKKSKSSVPVMRAEVKGKKSKRLYYTITYPDGTISTRETKSKWYICALVVKDLDNIWKRISFSTKPKTRPSINTTSNLNNNKGSRFKKEWAESEGYTHYIRDGEFIQFFTSFKEAQSFLNNLYVVVLENMEVLKQINGKADKKPTKEKSIEKVEEEIEEIEISDLSEEDIKEMDESLEEELELSEITDEEVEKIDQENELEKQTNTFTFEELQKLDNKLKYIKWKFNKGDEVPKATIEKSLEQIENLFDNDKNYKKELLLSQILNKDYTNYYESHKKIRKLMRSN